MKYKLILVLSILGFGWSQGTVLNLLDEYDYFLSQEEELLNDSQELLNSNSKYFNGVSSMAQRVATISSLSMDIMNLYKINSISVEQEVHKIAFLALKWKIIFLDNQIKEFDKLLNIIEHKKTVYRGMEILKRAKSYIASVEKIYNELISSKGYNFEENPNFKLDIN